MAETKLEIKNIKKSYGDTVAIDGLSLSVEDGQIKTLLGPSGCGKSTTLRSVAGLETPDSGEIYIDGELVFGDGVNIAPENRGIGMVFQSYAVWPHMTVEENVMYPLNVRKIGSKAERKEEVHELLNSIGLGDHIDHRASNLSGGQQQRVAVARALILEPEIILFDEPLSNLDAKLRRQMRTEIKHICEEFSITMLYVTHAQDEAMYLSDEIAIMNQGKIVEENAPLEIYNRPSQYFTMDFMGFANSIDSTVTGQEGDQLSVDVGGVEYTFGDVDEQLSTNEEVRVCFRPKHCQIIPAENQLPEKGFVFEGEIASKSLTRDYVEYEVDCGEYSIMSRSSDTAIQGVLADTGERAFVTVDSDRVSIFNKAGDRVERNVMIGENAVDLSEPVS